MRVARFALAYLIVLPVAVASCGQLLGLSDSEEAPPPTNTSSGGDASTSVPKENCLDGVDNDGDGLADCADPDCAQVGYRCGLAPPDGWELVEIHRSPWQPVPSASPCAGSSERRLAGPQNEDDMASCAECTCQPNACDVTATCTDVQDCAGGTQTLNYAVFPNCAVRLATGWANTSCKVAVTPPVTACGAVTSTPVPLVKPWRDDVTLCVAPGASSRGGAGCAVGGQACLPTSASSGQACIRRSGATECPQEWPVKDLLYGATFDDQRTCTPCECGPSEPSACSNADVTFFSSQNCTTGAEASAACVNISSAGTQRWSINLASAPPSSAVCQPKGGAVQGSVVRSAPEIVCCIP